MPMLTYLADLTEVDVSSNEIVYGIYVQENQLTRGCRHRRSSVGVEFPRRSGIVREGSDRDQSVPIVRLWSTCMV